MTSRPPVQPGSDIEAPRLTLDLEDRGRIESLLGLSGKLRSQISHHLDVAITTASPVEVAELASIKDTTLSMCDSICSTIEVARSRSGVSDDSQRALANVKEALQPADRESLTQSREAFAAIHQQCAHFFSKFIQAIQSENATYLTDAGEEKLRSDLIKLLKFINSLKAKISISRQAMKPIDKWTTDRMTEKNEPEPVARYKVQKKLLNFIEGNADNPEVVREALLTISKHQGELSCGAVSALGLTRLGLIEMLPNMNEVKKSMLIFGIIELLTKSVESLVKVEDLLDELQKTEQ